MWVWCVFSAGWVLLQMFLKENDSHSCPFHVWFLHSFQVLFVSLLFLRFCWYVGRIFLASSLALLIFRSFLLSSFYFLSLFFDVPVKLFTPMTVHVMSFYFITYHFPFFCCHFHVMFLSFPLIVLSSLHSFNSFSFSSHDPVIAFHYPFAFSLHFPFLFLSFYLSFPCVFTFMPIFMTLIFIAALDLDIYIYICNMYMILWKARPREIIWKQILGILRLTEKRHRNHCAKLHHTCRLFASYILYTACTVPLL